MPSFRVRYRTIEFGHVDIHLRTLRDRQQYDDAEGKAEALGISSATWPFFGMVWASSEVLAHLMVDYDVEGKRILEVGCGMALASLVLNHRHADITATDYHPEVEGFLRQNTRLNEGPTIPYVRTGWADENSGLETFDLIIGSDLLYERDHADLLSAFIDRHAKADCEVIIVDPGRDHRARFSRNMEAIGYSVSLSRPKNPDCLSTPFKGQILRYVRRALVADETDFDAQPTTR